MTRTLMLTDQQRDIITEALFLYTFTMDQDLMYDSKEIFDFISDCKKQNGKHLAISYFYES